MNLDKKYRAAYCEAHIVFQPDTNHGDVGLKECRKFREALKSCGKVRNVSKFLKSKSLV